MATRKNLRVVEAGEKAVPQKLSVLQAAATGDHRSLLVSMRERVARAVSDPDCPPRDLAALTRRLQDISKEIEAMDLRLKEDGADAADVAADEDWTAEAL